MTPEPRIPQADVHPQFVERWSPRAFEDRTVSDADLQALFEAARWAPSCFNEQPWLFLYAAAGDPHLELFRSLLVDANRTWADRAPVLGFVLARTGFLRNGKPNRWAVFDSGAAWMSLALQASLLGLAAHGMGGFKQDEAYETLQVSPDQFEIVCAFAVGHPGDAALLPPELAAREVKSGRRNTERIAVRGLLPTDFDPVGDP